MDCGGWEVVVVQGTRCQRSARKHQAASHCSSFLPEGWMCNKQCCPGVLCTDHLEPIGLRPLPRSAAPLSALPGDCVIMLSLGRFHPSA